MSKKPKTFLGISFPIDIKGPKRVSIFILSILLLFAIGYVVGFVGYDIVN